MEAFKYLMFYSPIWVEWPFYSLRLSLLIHEHASGVQIYPALRCQGSSDQVYYVSAWPEAFSYKAALCSEWPSPLQKVQHSRWMLQVAPFGVIRSMPTAACTLGIATSHHAHVNNVGHAFKAASWLWAQLIARELIGLIRATLTFVIAWYYVQFVPWSEKNWISIWKSRINRDVP